MVKIGQGCSRTAFLREDGKVVKKPRYDSPFEYCGKPHPSVFQKLMRKYFKEPSVSKVQKMIWSGLRLSEPCKGILAEYLVSLEVKDTEFSAMFALCEEIKIRKRRGELEINIVGIYEDANTKSNPFFVEEHADLSDFDLSFSLYDLHEHNFAGEGVIVDYAALYPREEDDF